jgi:hypothetical protein
MPRIPNSNDLGTDHPLRVFVKCEVGSPPFPIQIKDDYHKIVSSDRTTNRPTLKEMNALHRDWKFVNNTYKFYIYGLSFTSLASGWATAPRFHDTGAGALANVSPWTRSVLEQRQYIQLCCQELPMEQSICKFISTRSKYFFRCKH